MQKTDIEQLLDDLISREGGYSNHKHDTGGATRYGITQATARQHGYMGDMRNLPQETAKAIYTRIYWQAPAFEAVAMRAPLLAAELFDTGVNMGPATAASFLQRVLNALNRQTRDFPDIAQDGRIGPQTLAALSQFLETRGEKAENILVRAVDALQAARYIQLAEMRPANESFLYGWLATRIGD